MGTDNRILIKSKSSAAGAPSTSDVQIGELAVNTVTGLTYLGTNSSNTALGAGGVATEVSTIGMPVDPADGLGTSDVKLATQGAIKTYVDNQVAGGDSTLANTKIWIGDSGGAKAEFALSGDVTMTAGGAVTIAANSVEGSMINDNAISGQDAIGAAPANSDELLLSDGGVLKSLTIANLATNASFASGVPTTITVADESTDTTCFPLFATAVTGDLGPKSGTNLTFNSSSGLLTATLLAGDLTGDVTGDLTGNADTVTTNANLTGHITSTGNAAVLGSFTSAQLATALTNETGSGGAVFATSPTLVTPALGTPSALVLTNASGTVTNLTLVTPALGTPSALVGTNISGTAANLTVGATTGVEAGADVTDKTNVAAALALLDGSDTLYIGDSGDDSTVVIRGTLQVDGTTTTINSSTLTVADKVVVVSQGATNDAEADGAGFSVDGADATMLYEATGDQWEFNKEVNSSSGFVGALTGNVTGNADTVTTNANLTGHITSTGNAAVLGSFTSAQLATALTNETGSGGAVFATSPTLVTPALGTPSAGVLTSCTGTASGLTAGNVTTNANLTGHITSSGNAAVLGSFTSAQLATALTNETGSGGAVFATSPTLVTPALGTPSALVLTNASGTVTNLTLVNPALGTPASGVMTNATGTASGLTAGNVTTNANLTGHITSSGNAAVLGSFTMAQLNTAISNDSGGLADLNTAQTLTNKTLAGGTFA